MEKLTDRPLNDYDADNPETEFWSDGNKVYHGKWGEFKGVNLKTFVHYGFWCKDDRKCFHGRHWLKDANADTFKALNYTFAIDENNVYTITGKVKDADIKTFEVLDNGKSFLWHNKAGIPLYTPKGYAKDKNNVYYENYEGKTKIIKQADLETFESIGDTYFAKDKNHIFGNGKIIKKADINTWAKFTETPLSYYSKDDKRIFYGFWEINVDYETFELVIPENAKSIKFQFAKDKNNFYRNGAIISFDEFEDYFEEWKSEIEKMPC